jgi:undecaprenyl phosphate N,N'-diacetylbacillosamine 1-phosphate transferase
MIYRRAGKRAVDVIVSLAAIVLVGPVILLGWLGVRLTSAGPGFLHQIRVGEGERPIRIHKLRTMPVDPHRPLAQTSHRDPDVLPVGRFLRRLKIDELPQIANVLLGDMSLVGPRPCMPVTTADMPAWARRRFALRPGLTGLAQVNGNVALTWKERWRHDVAYVDRCSFGLDLSIMVKTLAVIFFGEERFRRAL